MNQEAKKASIHEPNTRIDLNLNYLYTVFPDFTDFSFYYFLF